MEQAHSAEVQTKSMGEVEIIELKVGYLTRSLLCFNVYASNKCRF
ncbi:920_t:CDS:2 [Funneliformis geosporum]|uniref:920_t:CDS:1 n=1 Tax=Funneliformis geosporum TaxID=1117311 RepID=A0A9W4WNY2_9GLOM|nr:920_t:CDS:2 [Funneliformis geosporum]